MQRGAFNTGSERSFAQGPFRMFGANKDVLCLQAETSEDTQEYSGRHNGWVGVGVGARLLKVPCVSV